jgi:adenine-specific DNA glycosylase
VTPDWRARAACRDYPTSWWFPGPEPEDRINKEHAKAICAVCPVKGQCLAYAEDYYERYHQPLFGIHGGKDAKEIGSQSGYAGASTTLDQEPSGRKRPPIEHGTWTGYRQHIRYRHKLCDDCAAAGAIWRAEHETNTTDHYIASHAASNRRWKERQKKGYNGDPEATRRLLEQERTSWIGL